MLPTRMKGSEDRLDYDVDFRKWIPDGDRIMSAEASSSSESVSVTDYIIDTPTVKLWIEGGEPGETAIIRAKITTQQGRIKEVCFRLRITNC